MPLFQAGSIIVMQFLLASQKKTTERLQLIQNSAARLLTRNKRRKHISPVVAALHWLPVTFRINFKVLLIYKAVAVLEFLLGGPRRGQCLTRGAHTNYKIFVTNSS